MWWWEYLSCFNYDTIHVDGEKNQVTDALSRYYKYNTIVDKYPNKQFVKADEVLDPNGELLPVERFMEIQNNVTRQSCRLQDKPSNAVAESVAINNTNKTTESVSNLENEDVIAINSVNDKESLCIRIEQLFNLTSTVKQAYHKDKLYSKILEKLKAHAMFSCKDGLVFTKNLLKWDVLCIPCEAFIKGRQLIAIIIDDTHSIIGHFGQFKTAQYIRRCFWWTSMAQDIEKFCMSYGACATSKDANSKPRGLLHSLPVPDRPWQSIGMDFLGPLPKSSNFNYLLVIID